MGTTPTPATTGGRRVARGVTAGLSLLVLAGAVVGLPLLLAWATPVLWEAGHDDLAHLLDRQDTGSAALLLIIAVGWIGWAQFTYCTVRELFAQLRGRAWHAPRGMGSSQRAAALLIGSILVLLPTSSALASDAQAAPAATAALLPAQAQARHDTGSDRASTTATGRTSSPTYTVRQTRPAESLWSIAEQELGDGEQWRQIAALNEGHAMTDGAVFRSNGFLQPGWQLKMPASYAPAGGVHTQLDQAAPAAADEPAQMEVVEPGDSLSTIAAEELDDGNRWPELFAASRDQPQPDGLPAITDPDVIYPGQHVNLPGTGTPDASPPARDHTGEDERDSKQPAPPEPSAPDDEQQPGHDDDQEAQPPAPSPSTTPTPEPSASSSPPAERPGPEHEQGAPPAAGSTVPGPSSSGAPSTASPPASPEVSASDAPPGAAPTAESAPAGSSLNLRVVLGAGALLAAAVTGALALRRTLQRRRRKPGEKIAIAPETSTAEAQLAAAAEAGGAVRLDLALRTLARQLPADAPAPGLPQLRAARIGAHTVDVLPEDLAPQPIVPFVSGTAGWWALPGDAALLDEETAHDVPAPYPGLVTIGSTDTGDLVLLNLAALPALLLDGSAVHITEVCTSLALELGMSPWASDVEIVTIGFGEDLPQLLPTARIAHMRQPAHALRDLSERLLEARQMPDTQDQPYLLLCASSLDADTSWRFADLIAKAGPVPVTLIAPASSAAAHFPEAEILNASLHTPQHLAHVGTDITVQRLEHAAYQQITTALAVSGQPAQPAEGPWRDVPDEPGQLSQPAPVDEPRRPATAAAEVPVPTAADAGSASGVFAALVAASTDPSALRLLPGASPSAGDESAPATGETSPTATEPASGTDAAGNDDPKDSAKNGKEPTAAEGTAQDLRAPEIRVLGPVEVDGVAASGHGPRNSQLAALLYFRPGRSADELRTDMNPLNPWSVNTLNSRLRGLRGALGSDTSGNPYVLRRSTGDDPYRLSPAVRCDWTRFLQLAERALPQGPAGVPDLEKALSLVRGRPFGGNPLPWAEPFQQEMITRIIDVAHTTATHRMTAGPLQDLSAARRAVVIGIGADDSAELLYRDLMRIEHAAGNRSGLHTTITRIQQINRTLDCDLETATEQLINDLLHGHGRDQRKAL
ncbi:LysM peptidoglycan-binding domain-containing protein [Streptomyces sp. NBC_00140]|uniref:LysM peptidoglycan-binding domain-containing protein n=1 Tax=Streptomyces sp. NBC_00140 TaxID=2975664 RepID=UPI002255CAC2|nr:LysM peptidoglycan-binding domain-containing protein [Streptomyces sp. NBC_00140]MCX5327812.1 LysM peptidoglycan-binding domain-containing protein [Streptomyces sp. NBC_00140]MCX5336821.1 LysM peptidoglycan-binding domain-containing protein [Streptomyces sp. NBC_00140]